MRFFRVLFLLMTLAPPLMAQEVELGDRVVVVGSGLTGAIVQIGGADDPGAFLVRFDYNGSSHWIRTYGQRNSLIVVAPGGERRFDVVDAANYNFRSPYQAAPTATNTAAAASTPAATTPGAPPPPSAPAVGASAGVTKAGAAPRQERPREAPGAAVASTTPAAGRVRGTARFADSRGIPRFTVTISGATGGFDPFASSTGATRHLTYSEGAEGRYDARVPSAVVNQVTAVAHVDYNGKTYHMPLHPRDGKPTTGTGAFRGDTDRGVVRDFELKLTGVKPDYADQNPAAITDNDSDSATNAFYGGTVELQTWGEVTSDVYTAPVGSNFALTLTPSGPLLDGSAGETIVRTATVRRENTHYHYLRDIPIGRYTVTVSLDGQPLRISTGFGNPFERSAVVEFEPAASPPGGASRVVLKLTR